MKRSKLVSILACIAALPVSCWAFRSFTPRSSKPQHQLARQQHLHVLQTPTFNRHVCPLYMSSEEGKSSSAAKTNVLRSVQKFDIETIKKDLENVPNNVMDGEFGMRGEAYVAAQFAVLGCVAFGAIPVVGDFLRVMLGPILLLLGIAVLVLGLTDLGPALSPWPVPPSSATKLMKDGLYSQVRHPMYAGLLASCAGLSVTTDSTTRLLLTAVLIFVLDAKSDYEESELIEKFGEEYRLYQKDVPGKFVPQGILELWPWGKKK